MKNRRWPVFLWGFVTLPFRDLAKTSSADEIIEGIRIVSTGKPFYCSTVSEKLYGKVVTSIEKEYKAKKIIFSNQEIKIMQLICKQLCTKEIAAQMNLAVRTIESHRYRIQEKIGARNMAGIALFAVINQFIKINEL